MFSLQRYGMLPGGALGALATGLAACAAWERGAPAAASLGASERFGPEVEQSVAKARGGGPFQTAANDAPEAAAPARRSAGRRCRRGARTTAACRAPPMARLVKRRLPACQPLAAPRSHPRDRRTGRHPAAPTSLGLTLLNPALGDPPTLDPPPQAWDWALEPLLFGTIGTSIDFAALPPSTAPRALAIVCAGARGPGPAAARAHGSSAREPASRRARPAIDRAPPRPLCPSTPRRAAGRPHAHHAGAPPPGLLLRVAATLAAVAGPRYRWRERLFLAAAWTPKATVQAVLAAVPLAAARARRPDGGGGAAARADWERWGQACLAAGVLAVVVCGTLGTLAIHATAPLLLAPGEVRGGLIDPRLLRARRRPGGRACCLWRCSRPFMDAAARLRHRTPQSAGHWRLALMRSRHTHTHTCLPAGPHRLTPAAAALDPRRTGNPRRLAAVAAAAAAAAAAVPRRARGRRPRAGRGGAPGRPFARAQRAGASGRKALGGGGRGGGGAQAQPRWRRRRAAHPPRRVRAPFRPVVFLPLLWHKARRPGVPPKLRLRPANLHPPPIPPCLPPHCSPTPLPHSRQPRADRGRPPRHPRGRPDR
jgi:hypothetical protein